MPAQQTYSACAADVMPAADAVPVQQIYNVCAADTMRVQQIYSACAADTMPAQQIYSQPASQPASRKPANHQWGPAAGAKP